LNEKSFHYDIPVSTSSFICQEPNDITHKLTLPTTNPKFTSLSLHSQGRCVILRDRKLNIAPAIKKQTFCAPNETIYYAAAAHPGLINNIPIDQFPPALYSPGETSS
jgi:hypothetical protein